MLQKRTNAAVVVAALAATGLSIVAATPARAFGQGQWSDHNCVGYVASADIPSQDRAYAYTQRNSGGGCGEMGVRWRIYGGSFGPWSNNVGYVDVQVTGTARWNKVGAQHRLCIGCSAKST